ncbi:hypothetical protein RBSWK_01563 [Rhodopirellula baltica SWK14]|uniref:Uncharacterized protein n=1 Tax=Rhodopirellula baltica SWK14 TaxID=993516 RepID=L7CKQ9_RHOBT|nr:hypothetical protein RBSWK_01563 [Rhodopirellula baltica SWK14]
MVVTHSLFQACLTQHSRRIDQCSLPPRSNGRTAITPPSRIEATGHRPGRYNQFPRNGGAMVENFTQNRTTQQNIRDKVSAFSCRLWAMETVSGLDVVEVPAIGIGFGPFAKHTEDVVCGDTMAFGPAYCFERLPRFCRHTLTPKKTSRLGELTDGLRALLKSLFWNPRNPAAYGSVKYLEHGTDDFAVKMQANLDPEWTQSEDGEGTLDFERLRNTVSSRFPEGVTDTRIEGLETGTTIDIKRLPFVGDPGSLQMFNGDLTAKVVYPFNGYWREAVTVIAAPEALDDPAFQCSWAFEKCKRAATTNPSKCPTDGYLPVVSFYALTHPGVAGRYMVQEVSVILNRQRTAVMGLQICYTSLHGWLLRQGNFAGLDAFLI